MVLFPYKRLIITTTLNSEEIINKLQMSTEPPKLFWLFGKLFSRTEKPFYGIIIDYRFRLRRIINYGNAFLPIINGKVKDKKVIISMRPSVFVSGFMIFYLSFLINITFILSKVMIETRLFSPFILLPLLLLVAGYILLITSFAGEVNKAVSLFNEIFVPKD